MTPFLLFWFAFASALVGYIAVSPMEPGTANGDAAGAPAARPILPVGRAMWLGFLAGLAGDVVWVLVVNLYVLVAGWPGSLLVRVLLLGATGLMAFAAVWRVMLRQVYRVRGPQLQRLVVMLLFSYPVFFLLGIFLDG